MSKNIDKNLKSGEKNLEEDKEFVIPIDSMFNPFMGHLRIKDNNRILFSGKFGIGKTYFLRQFFDKYKDEYFLVHLHPSSYQIASNEKIIDYIKTDVLMSVVEQEEQGTVVESVKDLCKKISDNRWISIALSIGRGIPVMNRIITVIGDVVKEFGAITEESVEERVRKKKTENGKKKKAILIVDDLDRLDPEHIFRIFNMFSALVGEDEKNTAGKRLGFDAVIFVADYKNLQSIFRHKYGNETESEGYFDKFYSTEVFEYNPKQYILEWLNDHFYTSLCEKYEKQDSEGRVTAKLRMDYWLLEILLNTFLENDKLNLRQLFTGLQYGTPSTTHLVDSLFDFNTKINTESKSLLNTIYFLVETMGSKGDLEEAIKKCLNKNDVVHAHNEGNTALGMREIIKMILEIIPRDNKNNLLQKEGIDIPTNEEEIQDMDYKKLFDLFKKLLIIFVREHSSFSV